MLSANEALEVLKDGNKRFLNGDTNFIEFENKKRLEHLSKAGQSPFAVILTCADSRIAPEVIFDQALGALFVIKIGVVLSLFINC